MITRSVLSLATLALVGACAQKEARSVGAIKIAEEKAGLYARAAISADSAVKIALAQSAGGKLTGGELEEEDGKLVYSLDISPASGTGIDEYWIDAVTGAVVKKEHEGK